MKYVPRIALIAGASISFAFPVSAAQYQFRMTIAGLAAAETPIKPSPAGASCKQILAERPGSASGVYPIMVNGKTFSAFCDMASAGGGWTLVAAQFEFDPVTEWNEGVQEGYDPSLVSGNGFALNTSELPAHTQTAFGRDLSATHIDYVNLVYTTGNIAKIELAGAKGTYHLHRSSSGHYTNHNPEHDVEDQNLAHRAWNNTLTFDLVGGTSYSWSFSPYQSAAAQRGFAMNGGRYQTEEPYAWTVWVR